MMVGYIKLHRGWRDNDLFAGEFSRADAWVWLIEHAAWKPVKARVKGKSVDLARGELSFAQRFMAEKWGWSKSRVDRFIADLRAEGMIETRSKIGATAGHNAGQGQSIIKLCNYEKYQGCDDDQRGNDDAESGAMSGQQRGKEEELKEGKKEEKGGYAFRGAVIQLNQRDFDRWESSFPNLDLRAMLQTRDDWLAGQDSVARAKWFNSTSSWLAKKQQEARAQHPVKIVVGL